ncbi:hypothetical protein NMG60_11027281 [Bertholletia excelsa]
MVGLTSIPRWLDVLLGERFFNPCSVHEFHKKNEKNTFCLDCCISLCPHCLPPHRSHYLFQIRRYVYQDVIRVCDAQKLIDCSSVQPYTTNSAKVVFLNQRPMTRQFKCSGNICIVCDRNLQDPYLFCSVSCKVHHVAGAAIGPAKRLFCNSGPKLMRIESSLDLGGQMTPDSVLDQPFSIRTSSGSSWNSHGAMNSCSRASLACTATTEFVRKKRSSVSARHRVVCSPSAELSDAGKRRKGVPQRSPMY